MHDSIALRDDNKKCGAHSRTGRGCGVLKPLEAFYPDTRNADGRVCICAACVCAEKKLIYQRAPEPIQARNRACYAKFADDRCAAARERIVEDGDAVNARRRDLYPNNRDASIERSRLWRAANHERKRESDRRYRERKRAERAAKLTGSE
jgi:hypothetical protein